MGWVTSMNKTMMQVGIVIGLLFACCVQNIAQARVNPLIKSHFVLTPLTPAPPDIKQLERIRKTEIFKMDGLMGNRADIPAMIATIKEMDSVPSANQGTTMLALARLGATEAIPAIDKHCPSPVYQDEGQSFAYAARARLLAETESSPHAQAVRFFKEIGETPNQMNTIISHPSQQGSSSASKSKAPCKETYAEEELADMIYHGDAVNLLADPLVSQIDFKYSFKAYYKIQLALMTPEEQRQYLINRIIQERYFVWVGQLLIDLGRPQAMEVIAAKLEDMDNNPDEYNPEGYKNLLTVLYVCGDHYQSPIWSHLKHPPQENVGSAWGDRNQLQDGY